jgi:FkbM family methyltransferase
MGAFLNLLDRVPPSWIRTAGALRGKSRWLKSATDWLPAMLRNRQGCIQRGLGRGLRFNGANSAVGFLLGTHDMEVQYALSRLLRPGMTVYDAGANVGFTAVLAAHRVAPEGRVVCFEPLPANAGQIRHNAALNGFACVEVRQVALGRQDGDAEFLLSESPTWGRLAQAGAAPRQSGAIRVAVRSLDSLAAEGDLPAPALIKMDVEGAEADALAGGRNLLAAARPVLVVELHHTFQAVVDSLAGLDYMILPLTATGAAPSLDGEFQVLAYPRERSDAEAVRADLAAGRMEFE